MAIIFSGDGGTTESSAKGQKGVIQNTANENLSLFLKITLPLSNLGLLPLFILFVPFRSSVVPLSLPFRSVLFLTMPLSRSFFVLVSNSCQLSLCHSPAKASIISIIPNNNNDTRHIPPPKKTSSVAQRKSEFLRMALAASQVDDR